MKTYSTASGDGDKYLSVTAIKKELEEVNAKSDAIMQKMKSTGEELAKLKETMLIMTGAKLAFQKIVDASEQEEETADARPAIDKEPINANIKDVKDIIAS